MLSKSVLKEMLLWLIYRPDKMQDEDAYKNVQFLKVLGLKTRFSEKQQKSEKKIISEGRNTKGQIFCG